MVTPMTDVKVTDGPRRNDGLSEIAVQILERNDELREYVQHLEDMAHVARHMATDPEPAE